MVTQVKDVELQIRVMNALQIGERNAVKMKDLKQMLSPFNDRRIRLAINDLRLQKYLILSSSRGYWFAESYEEFQDWDNYMTSYIADLSHVKTVVRQGALERYKDKFQLPLM